MKLPEISIIMPVYNGHSYLQEAINSLLTQSFESFELIIIDDASNDDSLYLTEHIKDARIKIVKNEQHYGIAFSLNKGLALAQGNYIARMDCDDISLPGRLDEQYKFMRSHPNVGISGTGTILIDENGQEIETRCIKVSDPSIKIALLLGETSFAHPAVMMRADLLKRHHLFYSSKYEYAEDYELWCRASVYTNYENLSEPYVKYRIHDRSVSQMHFNRQRRCARAILQEHLDRLAISYNTEELACHMQFSLSMDEVLTEEFMMEIRQWKDKLIKLQSNFHYFDDILFGSEVEKRYSEIVTRFNDSVGRRQ